MRTLYVTDLDGTLLLSDQTFSGRTRAIFADLHARGVPITFATAWSIQSAAMVTEGLQTIAPVIVHNGAFIVDRHTREGIHSTGFDRAEADALAACIKRHGVHALVYAWIGGRERVSWLAGTENEGIAAYVATRRASDDPRLRPANTEAALFEGDVYYITCIEMAEERLTPFQADILAHTPHQCLLQRDVYNPAEFWCEVMPREATKAHAMEKLRQRLGCRRVVAFGDAINDMAMFRAADECYAVANACPELKAIATGIIGGNSEDGVANWLHDHAEI